MTLISLEWQGERLVFPFECKGLWGVIRYWFCSFIGGHIQDLIGGGALVWRGLCIFSILLALLLRSLSLSLELAPTIQLHSTDSPYAYDNSLRGLYCLTRRFIRVFSYLVWVIILIVVGLGTDWTSLSRARVLLGNVLRLIFWPLGIFLEVNGLWFLLLGLSFLSSFLLLRQGLWAVFHYKGSRVVLVGFWPFPCPLSWRTCDVP